VHTPGLAGTVADPLAIGVSGAVRRFKVDQLAATPTASSTDTGWGLSVDALLPVVPVKSSDDRSNALTLNGSFVTGQGIADLIGGLTGGIGFPNPPNPTGAMPAPTFSADIDNGIVTYDSAGVLHTIPWTSYVAGFQYYLPPTGRLFLAANFTQAQSTGSNNIVDLVGGATLPSGAVNPRARTVIKQARYLEGAVFFDVTPSVRTALSFQHVEQVYGDNADARNLRWMFSVNFLF
jgi:hypothetical protein